RPERDRGRSGVGRGAQTGGAFARLATFQCYNVGGAQFLPPASNRSDPQEFEMQDTVTKSASVAAELKDQRLFRESCYVGGQWIQAATGLTIGVDNPATGEVIGRVPKLGANETRQAIEAANTAFATWSKK